MLLNGELNASGAAASIFLATVADVLPVRQHRADFSAPIRQVPPFARTSCRRLSRALSHKLPLLRLALCYGAPQTNRLQKRNFAAARRIHVVRRLPVY